MILDRLLGLVERGKIITSLLCSSQKLSTILVVQNYCQYYKSEQENGSTDVYHHTYR